MVEVMPIFISSVRTLPGLKKNPKRAGPSLGFFQVQLKPPAHQVQAGGRV
jgi:hypothetical protein